MRTPCVALPLLLAAVPALAEPADGVARGEALYAEHCAACHGAELEGQPDWRSPLPDGTLPAPPHDDDGHTWHHGDGLLTLYIREGGAVAMEAMGVPGFRSGMPAFAGVLSDEDIAAVLAFIKSRWGERQRDYQQAATEAEREETER